MVPKAVRNRVRLAQQTTAAEITAPMPHQKTRRLGGDHASLDAGQHRLGFVERQTDHLQPVVALVEMQDLALADHAVVVGHDPDLDLNTHALVPKAATVEAPTYPPVAPQTTLDLPHIAMLPPGTTADARGCLEQHDGEPTLRQSSRC